MLSVINRHYHYINPMLIILNLPEFMSAWLAFLGKIAIQKWSSTKMSWISVLLRCPAPSRAHSHSPFTLLLECGLNDFLSSFTRFNIENMILQENTFYRPGCLHHQHCLYQILYIRDENSYLILSKHDCSLWLCHVTWWKDMLFIPGTAPTVFP